MLNMKKKDFIEQEILAMILTGVIGPGEKLPSIRKVSKKYNISSSPVVDAYNHLIEQQIVESRPNSGIYVRKYNADSTDRDDNSLAVAAAMQRQLRLNTSDHYTPIDEFISGYSQIAESADNDLEYYFGTTATSSKLYPEIDFNTLIARSFQNTESGGNFQVVLRDSLRLRKNVARWMNHCQCKNSVADISIVRSISEGVTLGIRVCAEPGDLIAVESPGHAGFYFSAKYLNCQVLPVPSHPQNGLDVAAFEKQLKQGIHPKCIVLSATFSNPTGASMSDADKEKLTLLCARYGIPIVEDDALGELYFSSTRPRPLKSFDNDNVIYVSGFGKCINPETRLGYVLAGRYTEKFLFYKHLSTAYAHPKIQEGLAHFLESNGAESYLQFFRKCLKTNIEQYRDAILRSFPNGTRVEMPMGSPYLWVTLPQGLSATELAEKARGLKMTIAPSHLFNAPKEMRSCFRFNCLALVPSDESLMAVNRLGMLATDIIEKRFRYI